MDSLHHLLEKILNQKQAKKSNLANIGFLVAIGFSSLPLLIAHSNIITIMLPCLIVLSVYLLNSSKLKEKKNEQRLKEQLEVELQKKEVQDYLYLVHDYVLIKKQIIPNLERTPLKIETLLEHIKNNSTIYQMVVMEKLKTETLEALIKKEVRNNIELFKNHLPATMKKSLNKQTLKL